MKLYLRMILSGALLIALAAGFAACSGGPQTQPAPTVEEATEAAAPTEAAGVALEIVGADETISLTLDDLKALPATEGYAGTKSSTGKITPPVKVKGVALKDLAELIGGVDESAGLEAVAEDGYSMTFSFDQIQNGSFTAFDPATGEELKNPVELTAVLVYEVNGEPLDAAQDGTVRIGIVSAELNQVTEGHWSVKWVNKFVVKNLGAEWTLDVTGAISTPMDRATVESCGATQCHGSSWTDDKSQEWVGVPLWLFVGAVDDNIAHEGPAFNEELAAAGYSVDVVASDGYSAAFDAARISRNNNILVAYQVNDGALPEEFFPLRLVGADLSKKEMVGMIAEIKVGLEPIAAVTEEATEAASAGEVTGSLVVTGAATQPMGFMEADLRAMEVLTITAEHPKQGKGDFEGVSLNALLDLAGVTEGATTLVITASDGYSVEVSLADIRACANCLLGFTDTLEKFKMVMPNLPSNAWVKDVVRLEVK